MHTDSTTKIHKQTITHYYTVTINQNDHYGARNVVSSHELI